MAGIVEGLEVARRYSARRQIACAPLFADSRRQSIPLNGAGTVVWAGNSNPYSGIDDR
jgi:hypothetical protein